MTISAKIIADSINPQGVRITTLELEYPRFIHAELMTHRVFSRNSASSRAIPVNKMLETITLNPAKPIHWGKNEAGMQANQELDTNAKIMANALWDTAKINAVKISDKMHQTGVHKQIANRITEPFQHMKVVVTSTEWNNWDWLRYHPDAQPEIKRLAEVMLEAVKESTSLNLKVGEWHVPYYGEGYWKHGDSCSVEDALTISASCCAQVSYRLLDDSIEKARMVYKRLVESSPVHASPFEHQASPIIKRDGSLNLKNDIDSWQEGVTQMDRDGNLWSGNFQGWIQHRQLIPNNVKRG